MLTYLLNLMPSKLWHAILKLNGVDAENFHDWLEGFCPCDVGE